MRHSLAFALVLVSAPLAAQQTARTITPGMTKTQVVTTLGQPATARTVSDYTYMFYSNSCGKRCGMNDLVVLHGDSVVDAILRSPNRRYSGTSSSPAPISPQAARTQAPSNPSKPVQMKPGPANDTRPSIPLDPPAVKPAPTKPESESL
ncbi:MAG: outer membrane protein assembly factor BamE [bacterium]